MYNSVAKLYQYPQWELPASNVIKSHSLVALSGYKDIINEKQCEISSLTSFNHYLSNYVLLDERFYQLLIDEHYKLNDCFSLENIDEDQLMLIEWDRTQCAMRNAELNGTRQHTFPPLDTLKHGDIIQFRNERLQFSLYIYQAKKGTFQRLLNRFLEYIKDILNGFPPSTISTTTTTTNDNSSYELILIQSLTEDGYGIPPLFNDAPLYHFKHLSCGPMFRWIYIQLLDTSMPIYDIVQKDIELKKQQPVYRSLVKEGGYLSDMLINELQDGEEMTIEDLNSFPQAYVLVLSEVLTKLNTEWRIIDSNNYCNQSSSLFLFTKWIQELQQ